MKGKCIISFDCESGWGMLDQLDNVDKNELTVDRLGSIYKKILELLEHYEIPATFAFVGAFTLPLEEFRNTWYESLKKSEVHRTWIEPIMSDLAKGEAEDWFQPALIDAVRNSEIGHEVACHGFTHLGWDTKEKKAIEIEIDGIKAWKDFHDLDLKTFIFPRNQIGNIDQLKQLGIVGYRDAPLVNGQNSWFLRSFSYIKEFNYLQRSQPGNIEHLDGLVKIPGDFFLNWRSGFRKFIPRRVTLSRFSAALNHASHCGGLVHLWSHPHNFISSQDQFELFESCLRIIKEKKKSNLLEVQTQDQFCALS